MTQAHFFFNIDDPAGGVPRELAPGITARVFPGDHAMISIVTIAPHAAGVLHSHPEEQWGVLLEGEAVRVQDGQEIPVRARDFWRTPGGVPHTIRGGPQGAVVLDIFSPPREGYQKPGKGCR